MEIKNSYWASIFIFSHYNGTPDTLIFTGVIKEKTTNNLH
jgi:hypothetical protein